ncbi:prolyl oligopeptidase family serine peptidase [Pantoea sp. S62]|nr:prolyl oligopeptidase family serine peptidase [Pantoea sp. S62]
MLHDPPIQNKAPLGRFFRFRGTDSTVQDENLLQVRLNRPVIQADATASPGGRGPGWAEAILHDPPIQNKAPLGRFFRFRGTDSTVQDENLLQVRLNRPVIQADATASPGGRGPLWAEAILHDPPIQNKAPFGRFFRFCCTDIGFLNKRLPFRNLNNLRSQVVSQRADNVCDHLQGENDVFNFRNFKQCGQ